MMNKIIFLVALSLCTNFLFAQDDVAKKYANTITDADLKKHLTIVAGAEMEGRETASPGQRKAASHIENSFKDIGLKSPSQLKNYQQTYPLLN